MSVPQGFSHDPIYFFIELLSRLKTVTPVMTMIYCLSYFSVLAVYCAHLYESWSVKLWFKAI